MARTKSHITYADRNPNATPHKLSPELYADVNDCYAYPITSAEDTVMFIPGGRYPYDGDVSENADWLREGNHERLWKTVQAFEKLGALLDGEDGKRIVKYRGRDEATGFPLMERPLGGPLMRFYTRHCSAMWPNSSTIAPAYLHLVYRWSLQILSALSTIHKRGIIHMEIGSLESYWLYEDLGLALVGFMSADFVNTYGERAQGYDNNEFRLAWCKHHRLLQPTAKFDLFDWASLVYFLMTGEDPVDERDDSRINEIINTGNFPSLDDEQLGRFVRRCWTGEYENAEDVSKDVVAYLRESGVDVEGDDIRTFGHQQFVQ